MKRVAIVSVAKPWLLAAGISIALLATGAAQAQQKLRPGLWETNASMKGGQAESAMARMQEQLAAMPPDKRAQIEAMMAQRGMGTAPGGGMTMKFCMTPEQAAREDIPQHESRCKQTSKERSGNTVRFKFACEGEPPVSGEGEFTFVSDKELNGKSIVNTVRRGQPERMEMQTKLRWLADDCGDIKPRGAASGAGLRPGAASTPRAPRP